MKTKRAREADGISPEAAWADQAPAKKRKKTSQGDGSQEPAKKYFNTKEAMKEKRQEKKEKKKEKKGKKFATTNQAARAAADAATAGAANGEETSTKKKLKKHDKYSREKESRRERRERKNTLQNLPGDAEGEEALQEMANAQLNAEASEQQKEKEKKAVGQESVGVKAEDGKKEKKGKDKSKKDRKDKKDKKDKKSKTIGPDAEVNGDVEADTPTVATSDALKRDAAASTTVSSYETAPEDAINLDVETSSKPDRHIVFVGNLPYTATAASISAHFASLSPIAVRCLKNKGDDKPCRGIAFVEFGKVWHMRTCLDKFHHSTFDDGISPARKINVELTYVPCAPSPTHSSSRSMLTILRRLGGLEIQGRWRRQDEAAPGQDPRQERQARREPRQAHRAREAVQGRDQVPVLPRPAGQLYGGQRPSQSPG